MNKAAPEPGRNMGEPVPRIDARLKVTGRAPYPADIPVKGMAYGVLATTIIARGRLMALHLDEARAVPGVLDILTHEHVAGEIEEPAFGNAGASSFGPLHHTDIRYDGQIMALVVAETFEAAGEAAALVRAEYEEESPSAGFDAPGVETIAAAGASPMYPEDLKAGDFETAYRDAALQVDARYSTPTQHHNPIELYSTTAMWTGREATIHEPSQNVIGWRAVLAKQLKLGLDDVRVVSPYIGGAFGSKGAMTPRTAIVALASKRLGRPVRCVATRMQAYTVHSYRAETRHHIRMGVDGSGRIVAFSHEGLEVTSRSDNYVVGGASTTARMYGYGAVATKVSLVKADRNTPSYMRSPPETPYVYALEHAMNEMAAALGMDPIAFRRLNDTMTDPIEGKPFSSRSLMECYDQAAEAFGWSERTTQVGSMRDGDWLVGMGCATAVYPTNVAPSAARVRLTADGRVRVQTASHEIGTGIRTVAAQMAAERLGLAMEAIDVDMGDSTLPPAPVAGGSNSTASVCSAVMKACDSIRAKLFRAVAEAEDGPLSGLDPDRFNFAEGRIAADNASEPIEKAMERLGFGAIEEYAEFAPKGASPQALANLYKGKTEMQMGDKGEKVKYAFGAELVEVRVHARTCEIRVPRIVGAFAAGRIMNPRTARSQLMGGMIWGIGCALHEVTEIDRRAARFVNRDLQDYLVPVNADVRDLQVILVPEEDDEVNPVGVKGLGELGNVGTPAAIADAVYHATGRRIRDLPIRIDDLIE